MPFPRFSLDTPAVYTDRAFLERLSHCGRILTRAIGSACTLAQPGITPFELAAHIERELRAAGARPILKGLVLPGSGAFPSAAAISVNEVALNGVPGPEPLGVGDVLTIDSACELDACVCDTARSVLVGGGSSALLDAAASVLAKTLGAIGPGRELGELVEAARAEASRLGFDLGDEAIAHGTGLALHQPPGILASDPGNWGERLVPGMVLAIEPVVVERSGTVSDVNRGLVRCRTHTDGWSRVAPGLAAYEERTVLVTESGRLDLTEADSSGP